MMDGPVKSDGLLPTEHLTLALNYTEQPGERREHWDINGASLIRCQKKAVPAFEGRDGSRSENAVEVNGAAQTVQEWMNTLTRSK